MTKPTHGSDGAAPVGSVAAQVSREIVQLYVKLYGRGPTRAKTYVEDDYLLCVLDDLFTPAEQTLIQAGEGDHVHASRRAFQEALRKEFREIVERASERSVRTFMSQVNIESGSAIELFLFEPEQPPS